MSGTEHSPIVEKRDLDVITAGQAAHALELIEARSSTQDQAPVVDPYAQYRTHLTRLASEHVEDAMGDYLSQTSQEELGLTPRQAEQITHIAKIVVREFAFDVVKGRVSLEPPKNGRVHVRRTHEYTLAPGQTVEQQAPEPYTPDNIEEGRGYN